LAVDDVGAQLRGQVGDGREGEQVRMTAHCDFGSRGTRLYCLRQFDGCKRGDANVCRKALVCWYVID
jgi:hypothetical protein